MAHAVLVDAGTQVPRALKSAFDDLNHPVEDASHVEAHRSTLTPATLTPAIGAPAIGALAIGALAEVGTVTATFGPIVSGEP